MALTEGDDTYNHQSLVRLESHDGQFNEEIWMLLDAVSGRRMETVKALLERPKCADININIKRGDGKSPLNVASDLGFTDIVELLLDNKADTESRDTDGRTPLLNAVHGNHHDTARLLIEHGADVNTQQDDGYLPLMVACDKAIIEMVNLLLKIDSECRDRFTTKYCASCKKRIAANEQPLTTNAEVNLSKANVNLQRNNGLSPLLLASRKGHVEIATVLVHNGAKIEIRDNDGRTSLYLAARNGHIEMVQFLIEHHADVNACSDTGQSCLLSAVFGKHIEVLRALISAGAADDVKLQRKDGFSPLMAACRKGNIEIVKILLHYNACIEARDHFGRTALWFAAYKGHINVLEVLINHGAEVDVADYDRQSPVCAAAIEGHIDTVETLIRHNAIIRHEEGGCQDPLTWVAARGKGEVEPMLRLLINTGTRVDRVKNCCKSRNCCNTLPLMDAVFSGRLNVVEVLVEWGADIHARNEDHLQAVDVARYCGHIRIANFLLGRFQRYVTSVTSCCDHIDHLRNTAIHLTTNSQHMKFFLEIGADVEAENIYGQRPIHHAVRTGIGELVELLIQNGANVNADDIFGNRPLHEAVCHGVDVVQLLLKHGAKLNLQNIDGKTPLHIAVEREQTDVIVFLLKKDSDIAVADVWRNTPLHYLTPAQLTINKLKECIETKTKRYQHNMLVCNALDMTVVDSMCPDCYRNTPLHLAVGVYGHLKIYGVSTNVAKTVDILVESGADINAQNKNGLTPLHVARGEAMHECLKVKLANDKRFATVDKRARNFWHLLFISRSQNEAVLAPIKPFITSTSVDCLDDLKRTPLHYACMKRNWWVAERRWLAEEFIKSYSEEHINKQDVFGKTALHYAAMANDAKLACSLKDKKADDTVRDNFEKTPGQYTIIRHQYDVKVSQLRLQRTSSFLAIRVNFRKISVCVQRCFYNSSQISDKGTIELLNIIHELRDCSVTSYVSNVSCGCRFDYSGVLCDKSVSLKHQAGELLDVATNYNVSTKQHAKICDAIHSQVEEAMKYLAKTISHKDARFACEQVILVGSSFEETKIGCCDEFDYSFVLTDLSEKCKVCYSPESPPGFVQLRASTPPYDEKLFNNNGLLNTRIVKFKFEMLVKEVLSSLAFCEQTGFEFIDPVQDCFVSHGTTSTKLHTHVKLAFTRPVNDYFVSHNVSVDIVPALHIDGWWPDDMHSKELCQPGECFIVFTQPQVKYPWIGWTEPHGFITFARAESRLLREQREVIRDAYKVAKRMSKYFCQYEFFSSHAIKTALLWCLDEDRNRYDCTPSHDSDKVSEDELLRWVQNILRRLLCFAAQDYVPSYFLPKCHQPIWLSEEYLKAFHMRLYRHGLMKYEDLFSLNEQQSQDKELQRIKDLFVLSHIMCWTVLSDCDKLKLFVPSTINPLAENDVCTELCCR